MKKAVFLDRDGVLTKEKGYITSVEDMEIFPYAKECVSRIKEKSYLAIVVTNQSGVARGLFSEEELKKMNEYLTEQTGVDEIYYCPHYEKGVIAEYAKSCNCRKPKTGMIELAVKKYGIDITKSYMIGDRADDILMGKQVGASTILLESGYGTKRLEKPVTPDYILQNLREAVAVIEQ